MMKVIVDAKTDQILGCTVLGIEGGEIMAMLQIAMMGKLPYKVLEGSDICAPDAGRGTKQRVPGARQLGAPNLTLDG